MVIIFLDNGVIDMGEEYFSFFKYILSPCVPIFLFKGCIKKFASIKAQHLPLKEPHTFLFSFSLSCLPHPVHCPLTKMPHYPTATLFQYGAGVTNGHLNDWHIETLVTVTSLEIDLYTSPPNALLLLMLAAMSPFMCGLPANQQLLSFWLLLLAMPSYFSFPLMTSGCSAALLLSHAQIAVSELIFKLLCSYRRENQAWEKKKGEEEEIRQCGLICTLA